MYDLAPNSGFGIITSSPSAKLQRNKAATVGALDDYRHVTYMGLLRRLASIFSGRSNKLLALDDVTARLPVISRHYDGIRAVQLRRIRGSEERVNDFDANFYPTQNHTKERWVRVAMARRLGTALPAVQLIQLGDDYFVRDGHHRISVARAMGEEYLDAEVIVWQVAKPSCIRQPVCCELAARTAC